MSWKMWERSCSLWWRHCTFWVNWNCQSAKNQMKCIGPLHTLKLIRSVLLCSFFVSSCYCSFILPPFDAECSFWILFIPVCPPRNTRGLPAMFLAWNSPGLQCSKNCVPLKYHKCMNLFGICMGPFFVVENVDFRRLKRVPQAQRSSGWGVHGEDLAQPGLVLSRVMVYLGTGLVCSRHIFFQVSTGFDHDWWLMVESTWNWWLDHQKMMAKSPFFDA
jgi:hypothetical protein